MKSIPLEMKCSYFLIDRDLALEDGPLTQQMVNNKLVRVLSEDGSVDLYELLSAFDGVGKTESNIEFLFRQEADEILAHKGNHTMMGAVLYGLNQIESCFVGEDESTYKHMAFKGFTDAFNTKTVHNLKDLYKDNPEALKIIAMDLALIGSRVWAQATRLYFIGKDEDDDVRKSKINEHMATRLRYVRTGIIRSAKTFALKQVREFADKYHGVTIESFMDYMGLALHRDWDKGQKAVNTEVGKIITALSQKKVEDALKAYESYDEHTQKYVASFLGSIACYTRSSACVEKAAKTLIKSASLLRENRDDEWAQVVDGLWPEHTTLDKVKHRKNISTYNRLFENSYKDDRRK